MSKKIKVAVIGSVGLPANYGGWETLVDQLTKSLFGRFEFTVYCSRKKYDKQLKAYNGADLVYINLDANGVQSIPYDFLSMLKSMRSADVLLVLGVSGCIFLPLIKFFGSAKVVVNIDGLEWKRAKWGRFAKFFLKCSEAVAVRFADVVVADNKAIADYIRSEYGKKSVLIPYGGDQAVRSVLSVSELFPFIQRSYAFKVCRIEPENNLEIILSAFENYKNLDLVVVGNWCNSSYGVGLKKKYCSFDHIHLLDPIYDSERLNCLRSSCSLYIHGHSAGGTNPSLVEAMSLGLPILSFGCNFNKETTENSALYFYEVGDLSSKLKSLHCDELSVVGGKMKEICGRRYTWDIVSSQYSELFSVCDL